jgi:glycogen operon protein
MTGGVAQAVRHILPGRTYPLGASLETRGNESGVHFALFSEHAEAVELCLFDSVDAKTESRRLFLPDYSDHVWSGYVPGLKAGQLYGYRVYGRWDPLAGHRFNPNKLLLDPYAKAVVRTEDWSGAGQEVLFGYPIPTSGRTATYADADLLMDTRDSAAHAPLGAVIDDTFPWGDDQPLRTPWHRTILYEAHVKGLTMRHPDVPPALRGTYAALGSPSVIRHLLDLGVTAVELLPIHYHVDDHFLIRKGLKNYWGYNTLGYFAPDLRYSADRRHIDGPVREFKTMVRTLHSAGIEVILDVVYNHTCEGNHMGPTLCFKGVDNAVYYKQVLEQPRYYRDYTGCGNTLEVNHPRVLQLIMDSLRYWVQEMHVDGFRFDLTSTLGRDHHFVDMRGSFFDIIRQDPVLSRVKLIAEPWDLGEGGYQVGNCPSPWAEWNGRYRDSVRRYWRGDSGTLSEMATRLAGSSDLYFHRDPHAGINFITCHDGFTLHDLVSYNQKHNEANGENNADGENHNLSWNGGVEGPTDNPDVLALRYRQKRNLMATLLLSLGVPMITAGDELGRTQQGNNNAYCQDNELSWLDWDIDEAERRFYAFLKMVIRLRKENPVFQRRRFFLGQLPGASSTVPPFKDVAWYNARGLEMTEADRTNPALMWVGAFLNGYALNEMDEDANPVFGESFLILLNANERGVGFHLPPLQNGETWERVLDTAEAGDGASGEPGLRLPGGGLYPLRGHSLALLRLQREGCGPVFTV